MILRASLVGLASTMLLVALLAVSRLLGSPAPEIIETSTVEIVEMPAPPPPPDFSEPEPPEEVPPPPAPKLDLSTDLAPDAPNIEFSTHRLDLRTPVEAFQTDTSPADLPRVRKARPTPPRQVTKKPTKPRTTKPKAPPRKPVTKSHYAVSELDGVPRQIRKGRFKWPGRAKGTTGRVRMLFEINEAGRVRVIRIISSSDPALTAPARRYVESSRYTSPRKNGVKVKSRVTRTFNLKK